MHLVCILAVMNEREILYPNLKSPDYAFSGDEGDKKNMKKIDIFKKQ